MSEKNYKGVFGFTDNKRPEIITAYEIGGYSGDNIRVVEYLTDENHKSVNSQIIDTSVSKDDLKTAVKNHIPSAEEFEKKSGKAEIFKIDVGRFVADKTFGDNTKEVLMDIGVSEEIISQSIQKHQEIIKYEEKFFENLKQKNDHNLIFWNIGVSEHESISYIKGNEPNSTIKKIALVITDDNNMEEHLINENVTKEELKQAIKEAVSKSPDNGYPNIMKANISTLINNNILGENTKEELVNLGISESRIEKSLIEAQNKDNPASRSGWEL